MRGARTSVPETGGAPALGLGVAAPLTGARLPSSVTHRRRPLARSLESIRQCGVALCIVLGFSILSASIGSSAVRDRVTGAKRLQHINGLGYGTYWFTNFLYDMVGLGGSCVGVQVCAHACTRVCVSACMCVRACVCSEAGVPPCKSGL